jgi:hypothetical protein
MPKIVRRRFHYRAERPSLQKFTGCLPSTRSIEISPLATKRLTKYNYYCTGIDLWGKLVDTNAIAPPVIAYRSSLEISLADRCVSEIITCAAVPNSSGSVEEPPKVQTPFPNSGR